MSALFSTPKMPDPPPLPKPVRMPTESDPSIVEAGLRTRRAALQRSGRLSTILTDNLGGGGGGYGGVGSSGRTLGA